MEKNADELNKTCPHGLAHGAIGRFRPVELGGHPSPHAQKTRLDRVGGAERRAAVALATRVLANFSHPGIPGSSLILARSRVRRCCCQHPLPSEPYGHRFDAYGSSIGQRTLGKHAVARHWSCRPLGGTAGEPQRNSSGAAPARALRSADISALLPEVVGSRFPSANTCGKSAPFRGRVYTPIRPITGRRSLPPASFTRRPIHTPYGGRSRGEGDGLTTFRRCCRVWVRPRLFAGGASSAPDDLKASGPDHMPFGRSVSACFRWSDMTTFSSALPGLTLPHDPSA
jgi:hypothetical protein